MPEHTPGPWVSKREGGSYTVGTWVQQVGYEGFGVVTAHVPSGSAVGEADARLIAAAPDLLAACQQVLSGWPDCFSLEKVRAAVAKARGQGNA